LKEAVEKIAAAYRRDYQTPTQRDVIAGHMGYNSLNGKSLGVLSALGKYGLLEGRGAEYKVSDLAVRIIAHEVGNPERGAAIQEAATKPELFVELDKRFTDGKSSDQAIRSYLLMQKFIPAAADATIRAYRETKQLVMEEAQGYNPASEQAPADVSVSTQLNAPGSQSGTEASRQIVSPPPPAPMANSIRAGMLPDGSFEIAATLINEAGFDRLIKILQINKLLYQTTDTNKVDWTGVGDGEKTE
jgi:hypothetical protein